MLRFRLYSVSSDENVNRPRAPPLPFVICLATMNGGDAESSQPFLAFTEESQASTPVFQLLHHIKRDVEVCDRYSRSNWTSLCLKL